MSTVFIDRLLKSIKRERKDNPCIITIRTNDNHEFKINSESQFDVVNQILITSGENGTHWIDVLSINSISI